MDYERSSWKYMSYEKQLSFEDISAYQMGGAVKAFRDTIDPYLDIYKGGGSAHGGRWQPHPNKERDERFLGDPNTIETFYYDYRIDVKYDENGLAIMERHYTDHGHDKNHTNPHDHIIRWESEDYHPEVSSPISYWPKDYPDGAPEFKHYRRKGMERRHRRSTPEELRFQTISEFKEVMNRGAEVNFVWKGMKYCAFRTEGIGGMSKFLIGETNDNPGGYNEANDKFYDTIDTALEYIVGGDRLRDVITKVTVTDRTL